MKIDHSYIIQHFGLYFGRIFGYKVEENKKNPSTNEGENRRHEYDIVESLKGCN